MQRRSRLTLSAGIGMVLVAAVWIIFAPTQAGGRSRYVIVDGNSMEPTYHRGDLVLVRETDSYQVGDVVTYRHPDIGPVIHRIIGRDGAHYVFQGDNNDWIDAHKPVDADLLGKEWIHIPRVGGLLTWVNEPRNLAIVAAVIGVIVMSSFMRDERKHGPALGSQEHVAEPKRSWSDSVADILTPMVVVVVAAALVAGVAFSRPLRTDHNEDIPVKQSGTFSYTAQPADAASIYDNGVASSGEPLFRTVSDSVDVAFRYEVFAEAQGTYTGSWRLVAEVADVNGWKRTLELVPEQSFTGRSFEAAATLAFNDIQQIVDTVESKTEMERSQYFVSVIPIVQLTGSVAGESIDKTFAPRLEFLFDDHQLRMRNLEDTEKALKPSQTDTVVQTTQVANTISVIAWDIPVGAARTWSVVVIFATLALGCLIGLYLTASRRSASRRRAHQPAPQAIEVRAWADLLAISRQMDAPVQSDIRGRYRRYFIEAHNLTWQFFEIQPHAGPS